MILPWLRDCFELCGTPLELMSDNGSPFVVWMPGVLTLFGQTLAALRVRHLRTQINSPWTNGKIERVWGTLQREVLDRQVLTTPDQADAPAAVQVVDGPFAETDRFCTTDVVVREAFTGGSEVDRGVIGHFIEALDHVRLGPEGARTAAEEVDY
ncbi:MAG TPA: hypothetical protein VFW92_01030 [Candidatus Limnocylindrales bacterium]|nr:hypothetical protein [Candidatus Limnocylindrales bacterium]